MNLDGANLPEGAHVTDGRLGPLRKLENSDCGCRAAIRRASRLRSAMIVERRVQHLDAVELRAGRSRTPNEFGPGTEQSDAAGNTADVDGEINRTESDERDVLRGQDLRPPTNPAALSISAIIGISRPHSRIARSMSAAVSDFGNMIASIGGDRIASTSASNHGGLTPLIRTMT